MHFVSKNYHMINLTVIKPQKLGAEKYIKNRRTKKKLEESI